CLQRCDAWWQIRDRLLQWQHRRLARSRGCAICRRRLACPGPECQGVKPRFRFYQRIRQRRSNGEVYARGTERGSFERSRIVDGPNRIVAPLVTRVGDSVRVPCPTDRRAVLGDRGYASQNILQLVVLSIGEVKKENIGDSCSIRDERELLPVRRPGRIQIQASLIRQNLDRTGLEVHYGDAPFGKLQDR